MLGSGLVYIATGLFVPKPTLEVAYHHSYSV
jgi:hypothetical protein